MSRKCYTLREEFVQAGIRIIQERGPLMTKFQITISIITFAFILSGCAPSSQTIQTAIAGTQTTDNHLQETQQVVIKQTQAAWTASPTETPTATVNPCSDRGWTDIVTYLSQYNLAEKNMIVGTSAAAYLMGLENYKEKINSVVIDPCTEHARQSVISGLANQIYCMQIIVTNGSQSDALTAMAQGTIMINDAETELNNLGLRLTFP